jgi:hypothetical protein
MTVESVLLALRLPGLRHAIEHHGVEQGRHLVALATGEGGRLQGEQVWIGGFGLDEAVARALDACGREVGSMGIAAAVGVGESLVAPDGTAIGAEAGRVRRMLDLARVGECLLTPAAFEAAALPDGVGAFQVPEALQQVLGHPAHVLRDYR